MAKIYLSPAAHEHDRKCAYDDKCSENTHCNLYIDQMIPYLDAAGIEWKRSDKANTGDRYDITDQPGNQACDVGQRGVSKGLGVQKVLEHF